MNRYTIGFIFGLLLAWGTIYVSDGCNLREMTRADLEERLAAFDKITPLPERPLIPPVPTPIPCKLQTGLPMRVIESGMSKSNIFTDSFEIPDWSDCSYFWVKATGKHPKLSVLVEETDTGDPSSGDHSAAWDLVYMFTDPPPDRWMKVSLRFRSQSIHAIRVRIGGYESGTVEWRIIQESNDHRYALVNGYEQESPL